MARCMRCGKSGMMLKVNAFGLCPDCAQAEIDRLQRMVTPELQAAVQSGQYVEDLKRRQQEAENRLALLNSQCQQISDLIAAKQKELIQTNEELLYRNLDCISRNTPLPRLRNIKTRWHCFANGKRILSRTISL